MSIQRLLEIVAILRSDNGCPWDREQTLDTIKQYLVEECYEVIDAIDSGQAEKHKEELGDLLLQVALHARIQSERGAFSFDDVVETLCAKLVRRHPHVFGDTEVADSDEVLKNWEAIKAAEKNERVGNSPDSNPRSSVEDVPKSLPALRRAHQVQARAARIGCNSAGFGDALAIIEEELVRIRSIEPGDNGLEERAGELLFALVSLCRAGGVNAEDALRAAVDRFVRRFRDDADGCPEAP